jgi:uncharacterized radical SAM superfamily Fe-S cluster-containing enzyme
MSKKDPLKKYNKNYFAKLMQNNVVCSSKFRWSTVHLERGSSRSCHRTDEDFFDLENLNNFHNLPIQLETRQEMLDGKWPGRGCEYCRDIEAAGGVSDRLVFNSESYAGNIPKELFKNNRAVRLTPTLIEISLGNLCNMSCIYCSPAYSSVWQAEEEKFSTTRVRQVENLLDVNTYKSVVDRFFIWLENNIHHLRDLHILGGEPTHQPELMRLIDLLENHPKVALDNFILMTNLKLSKEKLAGICSRLDRLTEKKSIKKVNIFPSIDCWGAEQEYIRTGLRINDFEENFSYIVKNHPKISIHTHGVMTVLTIPTIYKLVDKINYYNTQRKSNFITCDWNFVSEHLYLHPGIMPTGFFDQDFDKIIEYLKNEQTQESMEGYKKVCNAMEFNPEYITKTKKFLDELDRRRGTDWRAVFPWFSEFDEIQHGRKHDRSN